MPNKLSEIFSDDMFNINGKMRFKDEEAYKNFLSVLEVIQKKGCVVPIEGVASIVTEIQIQGQKYPLQKHNDISNLVVGPSIENVNLDVDVAGERKIIHFRRYVIEKGIVLETTEESIIYFKLIFYTDGSLKHTLTYKVQFELANSVQEIVNASDVALALMNRLYSDNDLKISGDEAALLIETKNQFRIFSEYFSRVVAVEKVLGLTFEPKHLKNVSYENQEDIEELYILLCKKDVIRINEKVNSAKITLVLPEKDRNLMVGGEVMLSFTGTVEYQLFGHSIILYSVNLLTNAVVKEIIENEDGKQVYYGDTDVKPMYISFSAFMSEEEAQKEASVIMEHKELYIKAKMIQEYIEDYS